jgi:diacylglycerol kinase family enzyme
MSTRRLRATVIHNEKAGDRRHGRAGLVELMERAGYRVDFLSVDQCDLAEAVGRPADLIVVAGGDGTVAKIVAVADPEGMPIAILPLGTANNIATSLGIGGAPEEIVASWAARETRAFYPIAADGPWGRRRLAEGIGFGALEQAISELPHKPGLKRARQAIREAVLGTAPENLEIGIDGEAIAGRFAVVEIAAIPLIGPRLPLTPAADPSDRSLDICFIGRCRRAATPRAMARRSRGRRAGSGIGTTRRAGDHPGPVPLRPPRQQAVERRAQSADRQSVSG